MPRKPKSPKKYVVVVPPGQKPGPRKLAAHGGERQRLAFRLLLPLDDALRTLMKRRGELSLYTIEALDTADFDRMPLVDIRRDGKAPEVNMFLPAGLNKRIHEAGKRRHESLNVIVNSAVAQWLAKRGLIDLHATA